MYAYALEYPTHYEIIVTDGNSDNAAIYQFGKDQDPGKSADEAILLEEAKRAANPLPDFVMI